MTGLWFSGASPQNIRTGLKIIYHLSLNFSNAIPANADLPIILFAGKYKLTIYSNVTLPAFIHRVSRFIRKAAIF